MIGELKREENIKTAVDTIIRLQEEQQRDSTQLNNLKKEKKQTTTALNNFALRENKRAFRREYNQEKQKRAFLFLFLVG